MNNKTKTRNAQVALDGFLKNRLTRKHAAPATQSRIGKRQSREKRERALIRAVTKNFCPRFTAGAEVIYYNDTREKSIHLEVERLKALGVTLDSAAKIPDVIVHHTANNWLLLIEAVTSAGPVDGKRRKELKELFAGCKAGLVFVTAFETRRVMQSFVSQIAWESEVWIAEDPDHMIHFNGERFLGPYPDVLPQSEN